MGNLIPLDNDVLLVLALMAVLYQNKCDKTILMGMGLLLLMMCS